MYKACIIFLLPLAISIEILAQSRGFASYSVSDGLAQSNVVDIAEDDWGNLWLATEGGLCKFNGVAFTTFKKQDGLSSNRVYCVTAPGQDVWLGTNAGVSRYDGRRFQNFAVPDLGQDHWVNNILADSMGNIWFTTTHGRVSVITGQSDSIKMRDLEQPIEGKISGILEVDQQIWITTYEQGIYRYGHGEMDKLPLSNDLNQARITAIYQDDDQKIWLGTNKGLYSWANDSLNFIHSFNVEQNEFNIYSISQEEPGTIWVGTTHGAFRYGEGVCIPVNAADGLTDNIIYKIHRDREGTLWFGSFGGGIFKSLGDLFTKIGKQHGVTYDYISSITKDVAGRYWFGSYGGGVYSINRPSTPGASMVVKNYNHDQGLTNDFTFSLATDNETIWVATANGLNRLNSGTITSYNTDHGLPSNYIYSLLKSQDGTVYCGTSRGLTKIIQQPGLNFQNFSYPGDPRHNRIRTLYETAAGDLLLATAGGLKTFKDGSIQDYFELDSLKNHPVTTLCEDQEGGLWCAMTNRGILYHNPKIEKTIAITEEQGLSSDIVYSLVVDQQGCLWVGTPHGLDKICLDMDWGVKSIRHFGAQEGFFGVETNTNAVYQDHDGSIWFGTVAGAFNCNPLYDKVNNLEPITRITGVQLFSQSIDLNGLGPLPYHQNNLTFEYFGNSLKNPARVNYSYKLENFDRTWQPVTKTNAAVYTNLPPGAYTFKVKASNNDGVWNQTPAALSFEISPPFWRTWWFFLTVAVLLGAAGRLYYRSRVQTKLENLMRVEKIKNQEMTKMRRQVAEDFHDQVGNQLASITVLVQLIQAKLSSGNQEVEIMLNKLGQFTKSLFTGTRDFIWSIDPKSDELNEMLLYIRDFGEELFEYSDVNFHVESNDAFKKQATLPVGWSRHIVYIFKEALTNSLRHANCQNVYLNFNVSDHNYVFELRDDGKGLNGYQEDDLEGMGFKTMQERAQRIGGEILITSDEQTGTSIKLAGKIP